MHVKCSTPCFVAYYYGKKKRKIGRPPGGHTNLENGAKKPGKRKKRKKINLVRKAHVAKEAAVPEDDNVSAISGSSESKSNDAIVFADPDQDQPVKNPPGKRKRKYTHHIPPPSGIKTRGAKLPKFSFERKTHKKILLSTGSPIKGSKGQQRQSPVVRHHFVVLKFNIWWD